MPNTVGPTSYRTFNMFTDNYVSNAEVFSLTKSSAQIKQEQIKKSGKVSAASVVTKRRGSYENAKTRYSQY